MEMMALTAIGMIRDEWSRIQGLINPSSLFLSGVQQ
jgi:hypothetical protein